MRRFLLLVSLLAIGLGAFINGALFTGTAAAAGPNRKYKNPDIKPSNSLAKALDSAHKFGSSSGRLSSVKKRSGLKSAQSSSKSKKYGKAKSKKFKKYAKHNSKKAKKYGLSKKKAGNRTAYGKTNMKKKSFRKRSKPAKKSAFRS